MNAGCVADLTNDRVRDGVDDDHSRRVADVEAVRSAVDVQVIPSALTGNRNLFDLAIWSVARLSAGECGERSNLSDRVGDLVLHRHLADFDRGDGLVTRDAARARVFH